ncbi:MAG: multiheme c-type cytochrome [Planctomycetota bacterium]|nr:multiheme c-type cytochrome [Planctomycetota bacterium]
MLARACLLFALLVALLPLLVDCGGDSPTAPEVLSDTKARAYEVFAGFHVPDPERIPSRLATNPGEPWGEYTGSEACKRCHEEDYARWRGSFHSRTLYDATAETVFGDFTGKVVFDEQGREWIVAPHKARDEATGRERFYLDIRYRTVAEGGTGDPRAADTYRAGILPKVEATTTFEVIYAFGNRLHQPYVVKDDAGQHWVAPVFWDDAEKAWSYDGWRPYVRSCGSCHVTGIRTADRPWYPEQAPIPYTQPVRWNLPPAQEQWAEGAVGCEVCHGPGLTHIRAVEEVGVERYRAMLAAGEKSPSIYDGKRETLDRRMDACGQCHNFFTESSCTWLPGPAGFARDPLHIPLDPGRDPRPFSEREVMRFYPDGSHMSPCTAVTVFKGSALYGAGIGCSDCHDPHGTDDWADLRLPITNNELCVSCHIDLEPREAQARHSRHPAGGPGNLCVECHMPRTLAFSNGVKMMSVHVHSHSFSIPTGVRRPGGPQSACNICHDDRTHAWTRETLERWRAAEALGGNAAPDARRTVDPAGKK